MSARDDGFDVADIDVGYLDDPKIRKLVRACKGDEGLIARAIVAHLGTILASWGHGERLTVEAAAPLWLTITPDLRTILDAELLDTKGRLRTGSWNHWYERARARRQLNRDRWARSKRGTPSPGDEDIARSPRGVRDPRSSPTVSVPTESDPSVLGPSDQPPPARQRADTTGFTRAGDILGGKS